ncbi:MAG: efflux RND transporter periplasmic adaptor subunit, partial [Verrucomicrobia bacterium]|nr:efflux RND transporter periplasmic adaptor subunit [Verrucomicrobiota bacterium]
ALGRRQLCAQVDVYPRISGTLTQVLVKEGESGKTGETLFILENEPCAIKLAQAKAALASAQATLNAAKKKYQRFKTLADKELISRNEWDEIETDLLLAKSALALKKAAYREAELDLGYCTIKAEAEGRVGKIDIHPGHFVSKEQPIAELVSMNPLVVECSVTESEFCKIARDQKEIELALLSAPECSYSGSLTFIDNHFDAQSGLIAIRGKVDNSKGALRSGMSVKVKIPVAVLSGALVVPQKAVKYNQFGAFVYVVQPDNTLALRQVEVVQDLGESLVLASGITADEQLLTEGHQRAHVGAKVEIQQ